MYAPCTSCFLSGSNIARTITGSGGHKKRPTRSLERKTKTNCRLRQGCTNMIGHAGKRTRGHVSIKIQQEPEIKAPARSTPSQMFEVSTCFAKPQHTKKNPKALQELQTRITCSHLCRRVAKQKTPVRKVFQDLPRCARHVRLSEGSGSKQPPGLAVRLQQLLRREHGFPRGVLRISRQGRELDGVRELEDVSGYSPGDKAHGGHDVAHLHDRQHPRANHLSRAVEPSAHTKERSGTERREEERGVRGGRGRLRHSSVRKQTIYHLNA